MERNASGSCGLGAAAAKAAADFEWPLLVFPVAVTVTVAAGFLSPDGRCSAWNWWAAAAVVAAEAFRRAPTRRRGLTAVALFAGLLAFVWLAANVTAAFAWWDPLRYHNPAIMMLADGWNPVYQGTLEGIAKASGLRPEWMNAYHVIAMPKGPWYFSAAAFLFAGNPFNLFLPLYVFLALSCVFSVTSALRGESRLVRAAAAVFVLGYVPGFGCLVDGVVALAAAGLIAAMYESVRFGRWRTARLIVFSFWMAVSKQTALLHCCAFWAVFFCFKAALRSHDGFLRRTVVAGGACAALAAATSVSPYLSSTIAYGHPFYPRYTGDETRHPAVNITGDFLERNDDAAAMGHIGAYVNAFVSSSLAHAWYRSSLWRGDFLPESRVWDTPGLPPHTPGSPTSAGARAAFTSIVLLLLVFGGAGERLAAVCAVAGTFLVPTEMIGYMRYSPWLLSLYVYCVPAASRLLARTGRPALLRAAGAAFAAGVAVRFAGEMASNAADAVECKREVREDLAPPAPKTLICAYCEDDLWVCDPTLKANAELLARRTPALRDATAVATPAETGAALTGDLRTACAGNFAVCGPRPSRARPSLFATFFKTLPANLRETFHET